MKRILSAGRGCVEFAKQFPKYCGRFEKRKQHRDGAKTRSRDGLARMARDLVL